MNPWRLPCQLTVAGQEYPIRADFRQVLQVLQALDDTQMPEFVRWRVALVLFYRQPIPPEHRQEAMEAMAEFITAGQAETPAPKLLDWQQDARLIISDVNRVAGRELRQEAFFHWWSFLSCFHAIGGGLLGDVVAIRRSLLRGKKLTPEQQEFYRLHKDMIQLKRRCTPEEAAQKQRLEEMLKGR